MKKREFKISFFLHVWEKKAEEISLEEFHNDLRGARWKVLAESYRRWMRTGMTEEGKRLKGALNAVVVAGKCRGGHAASQVTELNGLALFDFDHCLEMLAGMKEKAGALPYVVGAFVSISGEGLKLIVRIDAENAGQYAVAYPVVARLSGRLLELHQFLLQSPTEVTFTAAQWEEHTSRFSSHLSEVVNERDDSPGAIVLRHGLMASRIAGVLTALRKGECAWAMPQYVCSDEDFHTAMLMTDVLLEHSLLLSTSVRKSESKSGPLKPYFRLRPVLQTFSGTFTYKDAMDRAVEMGIPVTTFKRLFRKTIELKIIDKEGDMYIRTRRGWRETDA